jgi:hypothetical protein
MPTMGKLECEQIYSLPMTPTLSGETSPSRQFKARKWLPCVAVALGILGLHGWNHCSSELGSHHEPLSVIPSGGAGDMVLVSCGRGVECGYIK